MAIRKKEVEAAENRILNRVDAMIDSHYFRGRIMKARQALGIDPQRRRAMQTEVEKLDKKTEASRTQRDNEAQRLTQFVREALAQSPADTGQIWACLDPEIKKTVTEWLRWSKVRTTTSGEQPSATNLPKGLLDKAWQMEYLWDSLPRHVHADVTARKDALPFGWASLPVKLYFNALCLDFEGAEREDFKELALVALSPVRIESWFNGLSFVYPLEEYVRHFLTRLLAQHGHIYLDVTKATLGDVEARWDDVQHMQRLMGFIPPKPGRPRGTGAKETEETRRRVLHKYESRPNNQEDRIAAIAKEEHLAFDTVRGIIKQGKLRQALGAIPGTQAALSDLMENVVFSAGLPPPHRAEMQRLQPEAMEKVKAAVASIVAKLPQSERTRIQRNMEEWDKRMEEP